MRFSAYNGERGRKKFVDTKDNKGGILVRRVYGNKKVWLFIIDAAPFEKNWGPYSEKEFKLRSKALGLESQLMLLQNPEFYSD